jgi:hypothetical protein
VKINKLDGNALKQTLDDHTTQVLLEAYTEETTTSNVKLVLGAVCVVLGLVSQFYPLPFPTNLPLLRFCVGSYCILSLVGWAISHWREGDTIFRSKPSDFRPNEILVASTLPRFSPMYTLRITTPSAAGRGAAGAQTVTTIGTTVTNNKGGGGADGVTIFDSSNVSTWFDENGVLLTDKFVAHVRSLISQFEKSTATSR